MRITTEALFLSTQNGVDSAWVQVMFLGERFYGNALFFKALTGGFAGLLGYTGGVHSG